jgi:hypothetical protein
VTAEATRELLASRADAWAFLTEPYHLADWWPGVTGVEPDRRGFAQGARWELRVVDDPLRLGPIRLPGVGRPSGPSATQLLVITALEPPGRWAFQLHRRAKGGRRTPAPRTVEVRLRPLEDRRTEVAIAVSTGSREEPHLARAAADRLYDLIQTAATM